MLFSFQFIHILHPLFRHWPRFPLKTILHACLLDYMAINNKPSGECQGITYNHFTPSAQLAQATEETGKAETYICNSFHSLKPSRWWVCVVIYFPPPSIVLSCPAWKPGVFYSLSAPDCRFKNWRIISVRRCSKDSMRASRSGVLSCSLSILTARRSLFKLGCSLRII